MQVFRAGFIGLIGQPNAGKSTLMNYLIDQKVSIVTAKPQTTRRRMIGIQTTDQAQFVFVDAPGLVKAEKGLNSFLEKEALDVIKESDALLAVLSLDEKEPEAIQKIVDLVKGSGKPWMAVITKTDMATYVHRLLIIKNLVELAGGRCLQISSVKSKNEDRELVLDALVDMLPLSDAPLYDPELYTIENVSGLVTEIVREKCFENLTHELPYQLAVRMRKFDENAKPCPHIYVDVIVAKDSQKAIVIGQGAQIIKKISQESRKEVEKLMEQKVFLELNVVVKENWHEQPHFLKDLGYKLDEK